MQLNTGERERENVDLLANSNTIKKFLLHNNNNPILMLSPSTAGVPFPFFAWQESH